MTDQKKPASTLMVVIAFATVYIVWGSTYFFIRQALDSFPPFILGAIRFTVAGLIMLVWCIVRKEKILDRKLIPHSIIGGLLMLFIGNGVVIWVEQTLPSAMAAILVSSAPIWFVVLDKPKWQINFRNVNTIAGLLLGFVGVLLLFGEQFLGTATIISSREQVVALTLLNIGIISWAAGSLYVKYKVKNASPIVNTSWQILAAGIAFIPGIFIFNEPSKFNLQQVSSWAWISLAYLILMGSIAAFSAYVWLLQVRPATQVSTYAYVNPVVAVLLGVFFAGETISWVPIVGLAVILLSVLLITFFSQRRS